MTTKKAKLLIVEDEVAIRTGLIDLFVYHGYEVDAAGDGNEGLRKALSGQYHLILLDVMLPGMNGYDICENIRQQDKEQPIIMLTAKNSDEEIVQGLTLGADDYIAKPFSVAQLKLRVEAVLRRSRQLDNDSNQLEIDKETVIDIQNLALTKGDNTQVFTRREVEVLQYLYQHKERPVPREELLNKVWGYDKQLDLETRTVDIHIAKIRRKIEDNPKDPQRLITVRGAGYRLCCHDD
ncbi:response regulator transcription factor [Pleionea sp. CnH1-48]|uniref:response regulator transcription factor n=1 Tax=Pleionea sp. CnH1-48 TaxID=2954494 RepID=UPI0020972526|nr:response regulator transcription factor [Pleionea sp. CnH1-48]MCO7222813.1 response regulator transcription factor [Pleionea sp. CnH1-48]